MRDACRLKPQSPESTAQDTKGPRGAITSPGTQRLLRDRLWKEMGEETTELFLMWKRKLRD